MNQRTRENDHRKTNYDQCPRKNVADQGSNPQSLDHKSDAHATEPPRPAVDRPFMMDIECKLCR